MRQAVVWNENIDDIGKLGYGFATVTFDTADKLLRFQQRRQIGFTLLADPQSQIIRRFGLLNEEFPEDSYAYGAAHPMIVVMDADGVVTHRFSSADHYRQPAPEAVLAALRAAPGS